MPRPEHPKEAPNQSPPPEGTKNTAPVQPQMLSPTYDAVNIDAKKNKAAAVAFFGRFNRRNESARNLR